MNFEAKIISIENNFLILESNTKRYRINNKHLKFTKSPSIGDRALMVGGYIISNTNELIPMKNSKFLTFKSEYIMINEMQIGVYCNLYGVVVNYLQPIKSKGTDFVSTVSLVDQSGFVDIKIFRRNDVLKDFFLYGDVVRMRRVKLIKDKRAILSGMNFEVLGNFNNNPKRMLKKNLVEFEKSIIEKLKEFYLSSRFCLNSTSTEQVKESVNVKFNRKKRIKDLKLGDYFDFYGYLVNIKKENEELTILNFVDYTANNFISPRVTYGNFYNDMILNVRVWQQHASKVLEIEENAAYFVKNLKVSKISNAIVADLSDHRPFFVQKVKPENLEGEILNLKKEFERTQRISSSLIEAQYSKHIPQIYYQLKLTQLYEIKEGINKVKIKIIGHRPFKGITIKICMFCKKIINLNEYNMVISLDECPNCNSKNKVYDQFVANLMVTDNTENIIVMSKNRLLEKILSDINIIRKTHFFALILSIKKNGILYHHLIDAVINK
ncbi:Protection of telomeres protein 1 [Dictyocoela muelleri]|nr:Protection of telomeres protein 1 [Dictyocoela muelleri]